MTALILLDKYNLNEYITTIYPIDYEESGKVAYIPENIEISIVNLLELLLVYSANDAAYISAIAVSGNIDDFVFLMNKKAKAFGMDDTNFINPDGLDEINHYTTLNDLLKMSLKAIQKKEILALVSKENFISNISGNDVIYYSTNILLKEGFVGLKTGWTDMAGLTFIGLNQSNEREIITIVNKSKVDENKYSHFSDTKLLYKTSIETFKNYNIINQGENLYNIRNSKSSKVIKSELQWIEFTNITKTKRLILSKLIDNYIKKLDIDDKIGVITLSDQLRNLNWETLIEYIISKPWTKKYETKPSTLFSAFDEKGIFGNEFVKDILVNFSNTASLSFKFSGTGTFPADGTELRTYPELGSFPP